jgi:hypothetical protein
VRRKAAKRTHPFDLTEEELNLVLQEEDEDIPARKKPRLEESFPTITDEATRDAASPDVSEGLNPPAAENNDADADPVTDTQPNAGASRATGNWTLEEDEKLIRTIANTSKKMWGKECKTDWAAVAALIPGRTNGQCKSRWHNGLDPIIGRASGCTGNWTAVEDSKLKDAVQTRCDNDWVVISLLVPSRTKKQCWHRWKHVLDPSIGRAIGRMGKWTSDEDKKLKDAALTHSGKDWAAISLLVPGRTKNQCSHRWHEALVPNIGRASERKGTWAPDEGIKLRDAVQTHGDKDWAAISALVPGRTKRQCWQRWKKHMDPNRSTVRGK